MIRGLHAKLSAAQNNKTLVRIERSLERGCVDGYVVGIARSWFALLIVGDGIRLDGYQIFRLRDVLTIESPAPHATFQEVVLRKRKLRIIKPRKLDFSSTTAVLNSACAKYSLITIHREITDCEVCHIGRVAKFNRTTVTLKEVTPDGTWAADLSNFRLSEITRVDFGGPYEEALMMVVGTTKIV